MGFAIWRELSIRKDKIAACEFSTSFLFQFRDLYISSASQTLLRYNDNNNNNNYYYYYIIIIIIISSSSRNKNWLNPELLTF